MMACEFDEKKMAQAGSLLYGQNDMRSTSDRPRNHAPPGGLGGGARRPGITRHEDSGHKARM